MVRKASKEEQSIDDPSPLKRRGSALQLKDGNHPFSPFSLSLLLFHAIPGPPNPATMSSVVDSETPERESWSSFLLSKLPNKPSPTQQRRLVSLVGSVLVALSAGSNYAFSSFAPQLQESLQLTSTQLNIVGVLGNMGVYLTGPLWGRWVDKQGPKV